jgi:AraC-like DNA-binding protein
MLYRKQTELLFHHSTLSTMQLKNEDLAKAQEIKTFLEKHYQDHFDYDYIAQKFHINQFKLKQAFKAVANDNIYRFLTKIRVERAKELLETTDHTVSHIATRVGWDKSNFNIQFKKYTGKTPSQWRNEPFVDFTNTEEKKNPESRQHYTESRQMRT